MPPTLSNPETVLFQAASVKGWPLPERVRGELRRQNFDRYGAFQPRVVGAVDFPHAAHAEQS